MRYVLTSDELSIECCFAFKSREQAKAWAIDKGLDSYRIMSIADPAIIDTWN
jgi:hypothetical protein